MLYDDFPHLLVSDSVFVGDAKDLSEASKVGYTYNKGRLHLE